MRVLNDADLREICKRIDRLRVKDVLITGGEIYHARDALDIICNTLKDSGIALSFSTAQIFDKDFVNYLFHFCPPCAEYQPRPALAFSGNSDLEQVP